jgi:hypothetical protein
LVLFGALLASYPYAALAINRVLGTYSVVLTEHGGLQRTLIIGPNAPRPDWVPLLPGSMVVQASHWLPSPDRPVAGDVTLLTRDDVDEVRRFNLSSLPAMGFDVHDVGIGTLNAPLANYLGIANILEGHRGKDDIAIRVTTRTPSGLVMPSRTVEIHWQTSIPPSSAGRQ